MDDAARMVDKERVACFVFLGNPCHQLESSMEAERRLPFDTSASNYISSKSQVVLGMPRHLTRIISGFMAKVGMSNSRTHDFMSYLRRGLGLLFFP
jgi:hypothetical protein